ncbi:MAG: filamentous hemagglutinin N-terminal domain-containing protein [Spirirestis rafaelensis WJT71-NPBG6]|jgi:filamentous hemagglutinin family protein|nr:filamentous hemagglutinin N-terminal domain-containing protein [Spirirestis rafaelensis WJT71-NPBG6]
MTAKVTNFANLFLTHIKNNLPLSSLAFQCGAAFVGGLAGITSILFATSIVVDGWKISAHAQITPAVNDANTIVNQTGNNFNITGGTQAGANLFHSFQKFGLDQGQIANFLSNPSIQNILGRVTGGDPSVINGQIQVTGGISNLYLINPAGIVFGQGASLSVPGSFTATTANGIQLDDKLFKALGTNDYATLIGSPNGFAFTQSGVIFNAGNLAVESGQSLTLVGGSVINTGTLSAPSGNITISAVPGEKFVRISESGSLLSYDLPVDTKAAINQEPFTPVSLPELLTIGSISQVTNATVEDGGVKVAGSNLPISNSSGTVVVSDQVDVSGATGGSVNIQGDNVSLTNANINASGTNGGGEVLISSGDLGKVKDPNRLQTFVSQDSTINADALENGNGGRVVVSSDGATEFYGSISAGGGFVSGDGGYIRVSGEQNLKFNGSTNVEAPVGKVGQVVSTRIIDQSPNLPPSNPRNPGGGNPGSLPDRPLPPVERPPGSLPDQPIPPTLAPPISLPDLPLPITTPPLSLPDQPLPPVSLIPPSQSPGPPPSLLDQLLPSLPDQPLPSLPDQPLPSLPDQPLARVSVAPQIEIPSLLNQPLGSFIDRPIYSPEVYQPVISQPIGDGNPGGGSVYRSFPDRALSPVTELFTTEPSDSGVSSSNVNLYQFEQLTAQEQSNTQTNNSCNLPNNVARATLPTDSKIADRSATTVTNFVAAERDRCDRLEDDKQILQILGGTSDADQSIRILAPAP